MKKKYESPMAEKYEFNYLENVVASGNSIPEGYVPAGTPGREGKNINSCFTSNTNNMGDPTSGCYGKPKK